MLNDIKGKNLSLITYSAVIKSGSAIKVNDKFGKLIDALAQFFNKVFYTCALVDNSNELFLNYDKTPIYNYEIKSKNVELIFTDLTTYENPFKKLLKSFKKIGIYIRIIKTSDYVYIFMPGFSGFLASFICVITKKKYFTYFGADWFETAAFRAKWSGIGKLLYPFYILFAKFAEFFTVRYANFCLVTGKSFLSRLKRFNSNVYETKPMINISKNEFFKKETFGENGKIRLLFVGSITERKGVIYLVRAFEYLRKFNIVPSQVELYMAGPLDKNYWKKIENFLSNKEYSQNIHYLGYISDKETLLQLYRKSDIFVLPTLGEGFPRVIYEAMSQSLPVIVSRIKTVFGTLGDNNLVLYCNPKDPLSIAESISILVNNELFRNKLVRNAFEFVWQKLDSDFSTQVIDLIKKHVFELER
jgi:glycosyltransferase involved in cell wall biosynthesis